MNTIFEYFSRKSSGRSKISPVPRTADEISKLEEDTRQQGQPCENGENNVGKQAAVEEISSKLANCATKYNTEKISTKVRRAVTALNKRISQLEGRVFGLETDRERLKTKVTMRDSNVFHGLLKRRRKEGAVRQQMALAVQGQHQQYRNFGIDRNVSEDERELSGVVDMCPQTHTKQSLVAECGLEVASSCGSPCGDGQPSSVEWMAESRKEPVQGCGSSGVCGGEKMARGRRQLLTKVWKKGAYTCAMWSCNGGVLLGTRTGK